MKKFDVAVVGSGIGGLVSAALLSKAGKKVVVCEKHHKPGGCAQSFKRKGELFDSCVHIVGGCGASDNVYSGLIFHILKTLGYKSSDLFKKLDPAYSVFMPNEKVVIPSGTDAFQDFLVNRFPESKNELLEFFKRVIRISKEARIFPVKLTLLDYVQLPFQYHHCGRFGRKTLMEMLDYYKFNDKIKAIFLSMCIYLATDPKQISFLQWAVMMMSYFSEGIYYCYGTYQAFADVLCDHVTSNGGQILCQSEVAEIMVSNKRANGLKLVNGDCIESPVVISNVEPVYTFEKLIKNSAVPAKYLTNIKKLKYSRPPFSMYFLLDAQFITKYNLTHQSFLLPVIDVQKCFEMSDNDHIGELYLTIPSVTIHEGVMDGPQKAILTVLTPDKSASYWDSKKEEYCQSICKQMDTFLPGFSKAMTILETASPETLQRYTGAPGGAMIGYDYRVDQVGNSRPGPDTPVKGLFLTGQWSKPGGGVYGVSISGCFTAQRVLNCKKLPDLFERLG